MDRLIGAQDVRAHDFAVLRTVSTGSWLGREHQGRGRGREMRAAVLHLAFAGLGCLIAQTAAYADNGPSLGVSRARIRMAVSPWWRITITAAA